MTMRAAVIISAKTGRRTETSASFMACSPRCPRGFAGPCAPAPRRRRGRRRQSALPIVHRGAGRQLIEAARRQRLVAFEAGGDLDELPLTGAERDGLLADLVLFDDIDRRHPCHRRDRVVGRAPRRCHPVWWRRRLWRRTRASGGDRCSRRALRPGTSGSPGRRPD